MFENHLQQRGESMRFFSETVKLDHPSFLSGHNRRAGLYRVMMPLRQFRSLLANAMWNHKEALRQGKWCFTMTPDVRDDLFWIDLAGEEDPTFKKFNWTQSNLPDGFFCSIDKLELSMEYHKTCCRTTHCQPPLSRSVGVGIESTVLSNISAWSSFITDVKIREMMSTKKGVLTCPPLPQEWATDVHLDNWPMICWTVGSFLVQK